tara:strand:- start:328 stop:636 length:309 start_codon:yes stop_codon:yes gene_type:complete
LFKSTPFKRSQRVSDLIRKEVANIFLFELRDPRLKNITISRVDMSDDLSNATIYYFLNFQESNKNEVNRVLNKSNGFIKSTLGKRLSLKKIPKLFFKEEIDA